MFVVRWFLTLPTGHKTTGVGKKVKNKVQLYKSTFVFLMFDSFCEMLCFGLTNKVN